MKIKALIIAVTLTQSGFADDTVSNLQLGISGGRYDDVNESIMTNERKFTLNAYDNAAVKLDEPYYVAITVVSDAGKDPADFGSFLFNGSRITFNDTTFGNAHFDPEDPTSHDRYGLWFVEYEFTFNAATKTAAVDTREHPEYVPDPEGQDIYYQSFNVDATNLQDGYNLHFDLYNTKPGDNGATSMDSFAPYSHDSGTAYLPSNVLPAIPVPYSSTVPIVTPQEPVTPPVATEPPTSVPEPEILILLALALAGLGIARRKFKR